MDTEEIMLPDTANSFKIASARSIEIKTMTESILKPTTTRRLFQTLPVHMRRRVMSHNCKRLPKRFRESHLDQIKKSGIPQKENRLSRKYRRKTKNLFRNLESHKSKNWLETHIWHAKRFFMTERWNYKLAIRPCDKSFRACYRACSAHCLIQDISYFTCLQISGDFDILSQGFATITSPSAGLSLCAKGYLSGEREGTTFIFKVSRYPFDFIGTIQFIWCPNNSNYKTVWLFIHPAYLEDILSEITNCFQLQKGKHKFGFPFFINNAVELLVLKNYFNIFRLTGPNSHAVLANTMKCCKNIDEETKWIQLLKVINVSEKYHYWKKLQHLRSPGELPRGMVLGLVVEDPRNHRPEKRTKAMRAETDNVETKDLLYIPDFAKESPMWDLNIYESILQDRKSTFDIIKYKKENQLIPGSLTCSAQSIPVLLIQKPGSQKCHYGNSAFGTGWDIIIPKSYGLAFWHSMILNGARAGGLREYENLIFENRKVFLTPDSSAGITEATRVYNEKCNKYFSLPPNKRVNYLKIGINSPFKCHWDVLLQDWTDEKVEQFYVLRDRLKLHQLQSILHTRKIAADFTEAPDCLVPIFIEIQGKGTLRDNAIICLKNREKSLQEPTHKDNSKLRRELRKGHKNELRLQRNKRKRLKKKLQLMDKNRKVDQCKNRKQLSEYMLRMRELWLPKEIKTVRYSCSKEVAGFVTKGAFAFTEGKCCGIGYVAFNALLKSVKINQNIFLVRNTTSRMYKIAKVQILIE